MEISCREVIRELSNYIDSDIEPGLREKIRQHLSKCNHCTAIYDGTRNIIQLVGDGRTFELPTGFSQRLREKLSRETSHKT
jgi:anti-sigma factor (TIGR02949 family)